ncbi:class E sortase [Spirillospora sp. NBC_00431]
MVVEMAGPVDADGWGAAPPPSAPRRMALCGEVLLTAGLVVLLFAAHQFFGAWWRMNGAQADLDDDLRRRWAAGAPPVPGQPASRLHIPRLKKRWAVVEGVTAADLRRGPGHYPRSQAPGEVGNLAIAGHRLPSVFWNLDRLREGDPVVVETRSGWYVYRVTRLRVVRPGQAEVIAPDPGRPGRPPARRMLTLTTCNPKFDNYQRLIVHAELARRQGKKAGRPAELR